MVNGKLPECFQYGCYLDFKDLDKEEKVILPMRRIHVEGTLSGSIAVLDVTLQYQNPSDKNSLECAYEFPLEKSTIFSKLKAQIDDKTVEAIIQDKEESKEKYEDAIASGKAAVYAERDFKKASVTIKLGNLQPLQEATLSIQLIQQIEIRQGAYYFLLPLAFYPDYNRNQVEKSAFNYDFSYSIQIKSSKKILFLSKPDGSEHTVSDSGTQIQVKGSELAREIFFSYRSSDMRYPQLDYAVNPE